MANSASAQLFDLAMMLLQQGDSAGAASSFERAAHACVAEGNVGAARNALMNLGHVQKQRGELVAALQALNEAAGMIDPGTPPDERGLVLLNRAGVMDRLGDPRAQAAWMDAAACFGNQPLMALVCRAHAAGAAFAASDPAAAVAAARGVIAALGEHATPALVVGLIGAVGESAGEDGIPFLAQAAYLMLEHMDAYNTSNAPHLDFLIDRLGPTHPLCTQLCAFGMVLTGLKKGTPEAQPLMARVIDRVQRCAAGRSTSPEALLDEIQTLSSVLSTIGTSLQALIPPEVWLVAP